MTVVNSVVTRIMAPPMVGVPAFSWWLSGPSSRTLWPICKWTSLRIMNGPTASEMASAVNALTMVRKVMY